MDPKKVKEDALKKSHQKAKEDAIEKLQKTHPDVEPIEFIEGEPKVSLGLVMRLVMGDLINKQPHPWNK